MGYPELEFSAEDAAPVSSQDYWRRIFANNPTFSSWHDPKQRGVRDEIVARLRAPRRPLRVLDYGIGNMGLYRSLDCGLLERLDLTGISESQQHDDNDVLIKRFRVNVIIGSALEPLLSIPSESKDRVISSYVFAYLDDTLRADLLREFGRILAPDGELVLVLHHPNGRRNRILRKSGHYWKGARAVYVQLLSGQYKGGRETLIGLTRYLEECFPEDIRHRNYLESYIRTAARFLDMFCATGDVSVPVPDVALADCEDMIRLINREYSMTCQSFRPVANPATDIVLPAGLRLSRLAECRDHGAGIPMANVYCATKSSTRRVESCAPQGHGRRPPRRAS